jgi:hypothetical protein
MNTFVPLDPFTNGELASIIRQLEGSLESDHDGHTIVPDPNAAFTALDRLKAVVPDEPTPRTKAQYPNFVEEFSRFHARSALTALSEECKTRGVRITPQLRKIVASISVAGLRMGMVLAAELRRAGIDPVEMLYKHGESQAKVDKHASELRAVSSYSQQFGEFVDSFVEESKAADWRFHQGGIAEGDVAIQL